MCILALHVVMACSDAMTVFCVRYTHVLMCMSHNTQGEQGQKGYQGKKGIRGRAGGPGEKVN